MSLRNNNHSALGSEAEVTITCGTSALEILSPEMDSNVVPGGDVALTLLFEEFQLAEPGSQANNFVGIGHYRVYLDGATGEDYLVAFAQDTVTVTLPAGLFVGTHTLRISLRQNDGTALDSPIDATLPIFVSN